MFGNDKSALFGGETRWRDRRGLRWPYAFDDEDAGSQQP